MTRRKHVPQAAQNTSGWLITYTDLCILLLSFFALLVSMSTIDKTLQKRAMGSVEDSFGTSSSTATKVSGKLGPRGATPEKPRLSPMEEEVKFLRALCSTHGIDPSQVNVERGKVVIRLERNQLFGKGTMEIDPSTGKFLSGLSAHLKGDGRKIDLKGHTDAGEGAGQSRWAERSWVLSFERARAVEAFLESKGVDASRMTIHGFGHYRPLFPATVPWAAEENPRVEISVPVKKDVPENRTVGFRGKAHSFTDYKSFFSDRFPVPSRNGN